MKLAEQRVNFVNQVSHELKTPLTNIRLYAELLEENLPVKGEVESGEDNRFRKYLEVITSESQRLSRLIANVLNFARGKKDRLILRLEPAVVDEIIANPGHFEAEEIVQRLKSRRQRVSRATVYRTLELLKECMMVERLDFGTAAAYYEHVEEGAHHDHLICLRCGNVIEFRNDKLERIQSTVCDNFDFQERYHSLRIFGLCSKCRRAAN